MEAGASKLSRFVMTSCLCVLSASGQSLDPSTNPVDIPPSFTLDMETAARLRPQLLAQSVAAAGRYATGRLVFDGLVAKVSAPSSARLAWELRIVENDQFNAYSSPDGTVYVESGLAQVAGLSTGLWAAILSHEIAHVVRRDWARRNLYQKSLANDRDAAPAVGDHGLPAAPWDESEKVSEDKARFGRRLETEADRDALMLMARAGYHPDFVFALHHLLHARDPNAPGAALYAQHPCWEERDRELSHTYVEASIDFERRWPEWYASPGGNPPVIVFAEAPKVRNTASKEVEIQIPMRCQNLAGAVEVVLRTSSTRGKTARPVRLPEQSGSDEEIRQLSGCTSPKTTVTFILADSSSRHKPGARWTDVYVLDAWGAVLARTDVPKLPR